MRMTSDHQDALDGHVANIHFSLEVFNLVVFSACFTRRLLPLAMKTSIRGVPLKQIKGQRETETKQSGHVNDLLWLPDAKLGAKKGVKGVMVVLHLGHMSIHALSLYVRCACC